MNSGNLALPDGILITRIYKPLNQKERELLQDLRCLIGFYEPVYENVIIITDFNMTLENHHFNKYMKMFALFYLINKPTCYQKIQLALTILPLINKIYLRGYEKIIFVMLSSILATKVLPPPLPLSSLYTIRPQYIAVKMCIDKLFANMTFNF